MTKEDKELLLKLKDICTRLSYGVKGKVETTDGNGKEIKDDGVLNGVFIDEYGTTYVCIEGMEYELDDVKPYLRPMSSMTEEEKEELKSEFCVDIRDEDNGRHKEIYGYVMVYHNFNGESWCIPFEAIDWLNAHHLDYRGLIEKGLAIEAPNGMYGTRRNNNGI